MSDPGDLHLDRPVSRSRMDGPSWATDELEERWIEQVQNSSPLSSRNGTVQATFITAEDSSHLTSRKLSPKPLNTSGISGSNDDSNGTFKINDSIIEKGNGWSEAATRDIFTPSKLEQLFSNPPPPMSAVSLRLRNVDFLDNIAEESEPADTAIIQEIGKIKDIDKDGNDENEPSLNGLETNILSPINSRTRLSDMILPSSLSPMTTPDGKKIEKQNVYDDYPETRSSYNNSPIGSKRPRDGQLEEISSVSAIRSPSIASPASLTNVDTKAGYEFNFDLPKDLSHTENSFNEKDILHEEICNENRQDKQDRSKNSAGKQEGRPLRLFNTNFDTYTREHLSALVTELDVDGVDSMVSEEVLLRSNKRIRLAPRSPRVMGAIRGRGINVEEKRAFRGRLDFSSSPRKGLADPQEMTTKDYLQQAENLMQAIRGASGAGQQKQTVTSSSNEGEIRERSGTGFEQRTEASPSDEGTNAVDVGRNHEKTSTVNLTTKLSETQTNGPHKHSGRLVSSSTVTSNGTTQSSANITRIMPDDVPNMPQTVGHMTFDKDNMKWIRIRGRKTNDIDENESSGTDDPFKSLESSKSKLQNIESTSQESTMRLRREIVLAPKSIVIAQSRRSSSTVEERKARIARVLENSRENSTKSYREKSIEVSSSKLEPNFLNSLRPIRNRVVGGGNGSISLNEYGSKRPIPLFNKHTEGIRSVSKSSGSLESENNEFSHMVNLREPKPRKHSYTLQVDDEHEEAKDQIKPLPESSEMNSPNRRVIGKNNKVNSQLTPITKTPGSTQKEPRSVSFSDGRTTGKMMHLEHIEYSPIRCSVESELRLNSDSIDTIPPLVSMRTKRIGDAFARLEKFANESFPDTPGPIQDRSSFNHNNSFFKSNQSPRSQTFLTECSFRVATDQIVRLITDIEPYEPYWESMTDLDISNKNVDNFVRLKEFVPNLINMKADNNSISYLTGLPTSLKQLSLANNCLTGLTSFVELRNIQKLNVSDNQIDSLLGLESLPHLREVNADNNRLVSCEGVMNIGTLTRLSLKGNQISNIDFNQWKTPNLEVFNANNNKIEKIQGITSLKNILQLNLDHNCLKEFDIAKPMMSLRNLRLSGNNIKTFDVSHLPNVRLLYLDENIIETITNSQKAYKIDSFSMRGQKNRDQYHSMEIFRDTRKLFLGGINMRQFQVSSRYLALQYLELAMCQISSLPEDFAESIPNVRTLNLCHNFISDITPLMGLERLEHLHLVSNRITRLKSLAQTVGSMIELVYLDVRSNPLTAQFYPPISVQSESKRKSNLYNYSVNTSKEEVDAWSKMDKIYRRSLADDWYVRRLAYRGVLMEPLPKLTGLDGVKIKKVEREKAMNVIESLTKTLKAQIKDEGNREPFEDIENIPKSNRSKNKEKQHRRQTGHLHSSILLENPDMHWALSFE